MRSIFILSFAVFFISVGAVSVKSTVGPDLVKREQRKSLVETQFGEISAVNISGDGIEGLYHVQFFTLEPDSLFLPVLLHSDMVLYVHSGIGRLSYTEEADMKMAPLQRGDLFRLQPGSVFYIHSSSFPQAHKLTFLALFTDTEPSVGAYSRVSDMFTDFDAKILQSSFKLSPQAAEEIASAKAPPAIVNASTPKDAPMDTRIHKSLLLRRELSSNLENKKTKKSSSAFNVFNAKPDFENCYGWTLNVNDKKLQSPKGTNIAISLVNMTRGSMMAPYWNPEATEVSVVLQGEGMIRVSCSGMSEDSGCESVRFRVREGDVFAVPKFQSMVKMSFNYEQFVLMGFSRTGLKEFRPEFLTGKRSVLRSVEVGILAKALNVGNNAAGQLLASQQDSLLMDCTSCAEAEEMKMKEESQEEEPEPRTEPGSEGEEQETEPERERDPWTEPERKSKRGPTKRERERDPWTEPERKSKRGPTKREREREPEREGEPWDEPEREGSSWAEPEREPATEEEFGRE